MNEHGTRHVRLPRNIVLYSDVDGTLLSGTSQLAPHTLREIERFVQSGYGFTIATGRSYSGVRRLLRQIPVNTPVVLCNGAYVFDPETGDSWWENIDSTVLREIVDELQEFDDINVYLERHDRTLWASSPLVAEDRFVREEDLQPQVFTRVDDVLNGGDVVKLGIKVMAETPHRVHSICTQIQERASKFSHLVDCCLSSDNYVEMTPKGVSKWTGILQSQKMRGVRDGLIYAVGDHHNDVEMIRNADVGFAVGNAVPEVKHVANHIIGTAKNHAVAQLLMEIRSYYNTLPLTT